MNARTKLNSAYVMGGLIVAAIVGGLAESWPVFGVVAIAVIGLAWHDGGIRGRPRRR